MRYLLALLVSCVVAVAGSAVAVAAPPAPPTPFHPTSDVSAARRAAVQAASVLLVRTAPRLDLRPVRTRLAADGLDVHRRLPAVHAFSVRVPAGRTAATAALLRSTPGVLSVEQAPARTFSDVPDDPNFASDQAAYLNAVRAPAGWTVQHGSPAVRIAVLDSGVDVTHPDLAAKIDGTHSVLGSPLDVTDNVGHGTFVAGVAAAATNNAVGVAGAGYDSSIMAVKISDSESIGLDDEVAGITWAADHGADVINLSFGGSKATRTEQDAISYAQRKGVLVVAAAGNEAGTAKSYPAAYRGVLAVGAIDLSIRKRASFSNYGSWVTVGAPGTDIYSTQSGGGYRSGDGTSFSSPLVAGEAALLLAQNPTATPAELRTAIAQSAHGYAHEQLGAGQVDFAAAFRHLRPTTAPSAASVTGTAGVVTLTAQSTAAKVAFAIDGGPHLAPVTVTGGQATQQFATWGYPNGSHTVTAVDCSPYGQCNSAPATTTFVLANGAPAITSPAHDATVTGRFTIAATAPGGSLQFRIGSTRVGSDATSPYALTYSGSALTNGAHTLQVVECSKDGTRCAGPSDSVTVTNNSLHPSVTRVSPGRFSPNGDKVKDTSTLTFTLPEAERARVSVVSSHGVVVRTRSLGLLGKGSHTWTWNGLRGDHKRAANGSYTLRLDTSSGAAGYTVRGSVGRGLTLDTLAPHLNDVRGRGVRFYPHRDGFRDTFTPSALLDEPGVVSLQVRNADGRVVRTLRAHRGVGRAAVTWNGRRASGKAVPAGTYRWQLTVTDAAGNRRRAPSGKVHLSAKRVVTRTTTLTRTGDAYIDGLSTDPNCAGAGNSAYSTGLWLINDCVPVAPDDFEFVAAEYGFTLPSALGYTRLSLSTTGRCENGPVALTALWERTDRDDWDVPSTTEVRKCPQRSVRLGGVPAPNHVTAKHRVRVWVAVDNSLVTERGSDFDLATVRLKVSYTVLK